MIQQIKPITIFRGEEILAHHTTASPLSHYGQAVWVVEVYEPDPGPATWRQNDIRIDIVVLETRGGWLVCRQPDGNLCGIIWSDGSYHADLIVDAAGRPCKRLEKNGRYQVRHTVKIYDDPDDLGAILF
jgi:hypothetical protein